MPLDKSATLKHRLTHWRSSSRYDHLDALRGVSFNVPEGQFLGIIGGNGSGKSTLLKVLSRIYPPTSGTVAIKGTVSPFLELGVGFNPELTARENVFLNGAVLGLTRRELQRRVDDIIAFAEVSRFAEAKLKNFSSGMQVRLAFSVAIQADASILLMDEVLAVGDASFQERCFDVFARYKREGRTIVLVTHDLDSVSRYCDRAILLDQGAVVADDKPGKVVGMYRRLVGEAHDQTTPVEVDSHHWGSGETVIEEVQVLRGDGSPHSVVASREPMAIAVRLRGHGSRGARLVCAIAVNRSDGLQIAASNSHVNGVVLVAPGLGETCTVTWRLPRLALLAGSYLISVTLHDYDTNHVYSAWDLSVPFRVMQDTQNWGLVDFEGEWLLEAPATQHTQVTASGPA